MPLNGYRSLMLKPGHYEAIRDYAESLEVPVKPGRLVTHLIEQVEVKVEKPSPEIRQAIEFADWLKPRRRKFESATVSDECMETLEKKVSSLKAAIARYYHEEEGREPPFTYCAGVWLMLAIEKQRPGYLAGWMCNHPKYQEFIMEKRKLGIAVSTPQA